LILEITERLLLEPNATTNRVLKKLYASGTQLSIDDFGTGYSALSYLSKFNIDYLKLDKIFVQNLKTDKNNVILCETIIQMAHKLGIKVIAEGIETEAQRKLLLKLGCEYGQGYLFSKAVPLDALLRYTTSSNVIPFTLHSA
jgi:sensor c-di-GMP phosphodiesterase-like protein